MYNSLISIYFFIGFVSDLILNYLSRQTYAPASIKALEVYFLRASIKSPGKRILISAIDAGLTIVVAIILTMLLSYLLLNNAYPTYKRLSELIKFLIIAFIVGYIMDVIIYKTELFGPTLTPFYKIAGAGFWGAAAFIFSIIIHQCILFLSARGLL